MSVINAIGLMSGTSLDGIDIALIRTDGENMVEAGPSATYPYARGLQENLRELLVGKGDILRTEKAMTEAHAEVVKRFLQEQQIAQGTVDVIGFHGQTIIHRPEESVTWQIGNGALLAELTGIDVVCDFRRRDMAKGGQGAPLVPLYHAAIAEKAEKPLAIVNIGGVANITWIGEGEGNILAFDTGPGNALLDDWVYQHTGRTCDKDGDIARKGKVQEPLLQNMLLHPYFAATPPKSLDRNYFLLRQFQDLSLEDGAATLSAFTAQAISLAVAHLPEAPKAWYITGGGRHNPYIMQLLAEILPGAVQAVENLDVDGDSLEAQAFAYLAVRSLKGLPLTLPTATGASQPVTGGAFYRA